MASPLRPDPNEPQRPYKELERDRFARQQMNRRTYRAGAYAWWWVFWIIAIAIAIWWAGWGWGGSGGWWWGGRGRTVPYGSTYKGMGGVNGNTALGAISGPGLSALTATDKQPYIGKAFAVNNVPVQSQVNDHVFWIGANNFTPMLVVLAGNGNTTANAHIGQGTLVDVTGITQKAPPQAQAQEQWELSGDDAAQLERQGVYIQATKLFAVRPR